MADKNIIFVGKVAKIIYNNEKEDIDWDLILAAFDFKNLLETHPRLLNSQFLNDEDYPEQIKYVLRDAYLENPIKSKEMMNHIIKEDLKISKGYLNEYRGLTEFLNDKQPPSEINSIEKNSSKEKIKVFISYSNKEKLVAAEVKEILERLGINSFMAHNDIEISEEWKKRILNELKEADIFIPILSNNFKDSKWCSQEAGIACFRDILLIPLTLDKSINPYGFMDHRQGKPITGVGRKKVPLDYLINPIKKEFPEFNLFDHLIDELDNVGSFSEAESVMNKLEPFFNRLNTNEVGKVVTISIDNCQIWKANKCRLFYLPNFIKINHDKIDGKKLKKLKERIKQK
ncbi:MAG: hypothetical protein CIT01_03370 [Methanobacterium sp. BRmetb2]|jgi:hypothetical protein|nr:MAG: hypothetical protein CIT01_03370 [Methanobacterium sp. BRmetb2]